MNKKQLWDLMQGKAPELVEGKVFENVTKAELEGIAALAGLDISGKAASAEGAGDKLLAEACKAYGIAPKYVNSSAVVGDVAVIVTHGGSKVRFKAGQKVELLEQIAVTGINPKSKRKPISGAAKE